MYVVCTRSNQDFVLISSPMSTAQGSGNCQIQMSVTSWLFIHICRYFFSRLSNTAYRYRKSILIIETYSIDFLVPRLSNTAYRYRKSILIIETYSIDFLAPYTSKYRILFDNCPSPQVCHEEWAIIGKFTIPCLNQVFLNSYRVWRSKTLCDILSI